MVRAATLSDFQRHIDDIIHLGERDARNEIQRARGSASQQGAPRSNRTVVAVYERLDRIHSGSIKQMLSLVDRFRKIAPSLEVETLIPVITTRMSQFQEGLLASTAGIGLAADNTRFFNQYAAIFRQRLDHAIKDVEIGYFDSNEQQPQQIKDSDRRLRMLQILYQLRHDPGLVAIPIDASVSKQEQTIEINICQQLHDGRLIEFKQPVKGALEGMAKITVLGVDVIEGRAQSPIAITNQSSTETFSNFAPGMNFSNFRFAPDNNLTDSSQASDNNERENGSDERSRLLTRLDQIERDLHDIKPLVDLYHRSIHEHGGIGHNGPPEPIDPPPLSPDEYERALEATGALRAEISIEKPKPAVLKFGLSVLRRTAVGVKALLDWAGTQANNFVAAGVKSAGTVTGAALATKAALVINISIPNLEADLVQLATQIETWLRAML